MNSIMSEMCLMSLKYILHTLLCLMLSNKIVRFIDSNTQKVSLKEERFLRIQLFFFPFRDTFCLPELFFYFLIKKNLQSKAFFIQCRHIS